MKKIIEFSYKEEYLLQTIKGGYRGGPGDNEG